MYFDIKNGEKFDKPNGPSRTNNLGEVKDFSNLLELLGAREIAVK